MRRQELQQLVFHVRQVERMAFDPRLVRLEVERQRAVLDQLRPGPPPGPPEQVLEPGLELQRLEGVKAEVVEQVLTQLEVGELPAGDQQEERLERHVALP